MTSPNTCTDLSPVDLKPFKDLPKLKDLPLATQAQEEVQALYKTVEAYQRVDSKGGQGNGDGIVDSAELDKFLAANPGLKTAGATSCTLLHEVRTLAQKAPTLKSTLTQAPDLSPVELAPLRSLPYLEEFLKFKLPEMTPPASKDPQALLEFRQKFAAEFQKNMKEAGIPEELQALLVTDEGVSQIYTGARLYLSLDKDQDGKVSVEDIEKAKAERKLTSKDPNTDPALLLAEVRTQVPQISIMGARLQGILRVKPDPKRVDVTILAGLYSKAPKFVEADPDLKTLLNFVAKPVMKANEKGEMVATGEMKFIPEVSDGALTLDELKANSEAMLVLNGKNLTPEAFFAKIQASMAQLRSPMYLWPEEVLKRLKDAGEESYKAIFELQVLNDDQRRSELVLHFLDKTNKGKYQQEMMDHSGAAGSSYMGWFVGHVAGWVGIWDKAESWNEHFQKTRPESHLKERTDAIEALKNVMRENPENLKKIEDALSYMENNGMGGHAKALKEYCDIEQWIRTANIKDDLERYKALDRIGDDYRSGTWKGFWDLQVIPLPSLGEGGFWNRASSLSNWTWGKSPDLPITLAIDNFLAREIPNTYELENQGKSQVLTFQFTEQERKSFDEIIERAIKGETVDGKAVEDLLSKSSLTAEGRKVLSDRYHSAVLSGQNKKLFDEVSNLEYVKSMKEDGLQKVNGIFGAAAGGIYKTAQLEHELDALNLSSKNTSDLKTYLGRVQAVLPPDESGGINTLFHEAQLGNNEPRAREIFGKITPTDDEKKEFEKLVDGSKLSSDNQKILKGAFAIQAYNRIAEAAHKEFFQILGNPMKDPMDPTGKTFDPKSVGNLHNSIRTTVDRGVGLVMVGAPTIVGGGVGYTLAKTPMHFNAFGKKMPFPLVIGTAGGAVGYFTADDEHKVRNTAIGFGVGTGISYGLSKFVKGRGLNPWWGAMAIGLAGSFYTAGTWKGDSIGGMGWEVMQTPYRPWSDFSVRDMPSELTGLYLDFAVGTKAMGGILDGVKLIGAMEIVQKIVKWGKLSPLGTRKAVGVGLGAGLGGLQGWDMTPADASTGTKIRNIAGGAAAGGLFSYGLYRNKLWTFTAGGAATGGYIGYNAVDPEDMDNTNKRIRYAMVGAVAGGGLVHLMGRGVAQYFKASETMLVPGATTAPKGTWVSPWAEAQHTRVLEQINALEGMTARSAADMEKITRLRSAAETARAAGEMKKYGEILDDLVALEGSPRLMELRQMALAYEKLGKAGGYPHFSANVLSEAEKLHLAGNLDKANFMIVRGAHELSIMEKGGMANSRIAKLLLTGAVADKVDGKIKPPTPLIPPFDSDFKGNLRAAPKPATSANPNGGL